MEEIDHGSERKSTEGEGGAGGVVPLGWVSDEELVAVYLNGCSRARNTNDPKIYRPLGVAAVRKAVEAPLLAERDTLRAELAAVTAERERLWSLYERSVGKDELEARLALRERLGVPDHDWTTKYVLDALDELESAREQLAILHPGETVEGVVMERDSYRIHLERAQQDLATVTAEAISNG